MYIAPMPQLPKVPWKCITLQTSIHPRHKFILWLALLKRLATVARLAKFGVQVDSICVFCKAAMETQDHIFFDYLITRHLWCRILKWLGFTRTIGDWQHEVDWIISWATKRAGQGAIICCAFAMVINVIWRERNMIKFQNGNYQIDRVCKEIAIHIHIKGKNQKT
ncbi:hypothetical protein R3W88_029631 [Solanum pinnatisectum]|uniref:Reverse transcriptase zinc-binding domain-containing protein n=1 Tax=Solanum pinnatisectum TaxID=50273 RepID=A0AAV9K5X1_9SOLN|nr:hypothetical protein R3W88_029631 [Solanum pinnatisectum]